MQTLKWIALFGALASVSTALGGEAKKAKRAPVRKLAAVERSWDSGRVTGPGQRSRKETILKLGLNGGYARLASNSNKTQAAREKNGTNEGFALGLNAHLDFMSYGYADVEAFYVGNASSQSFTDVDQVNGKVTTGTQRVRAYGFLAESGARMPLGRGTVRWIPSLGVGIGYVNVDDEKESGAGTESEEHRALAPYVSAGLGVAIGPRFSLSGDASLSVFGRQQGEENPSLSDSRSAQFARVRAGAYYRVNEPMTVGLQYLQRTLQTNQLRGVYGSRDTTRQVLGSLQFNF